MKKIILLALFFAAQNATAQNIGIGTNTPQATLDVKGNQRIGGTSNYMTFDSLSAKIEWKNAYLYAPVSQALMKHSAAADGLFYNNIGGLGKIEYRNALGNPVFYTSFMTGDGYFSNNLGIGNLTPQFPLSFTGSLGDKISLWGDGTATHYGLGIQSGLLQIFSKTDFDNIGFGYGSSSSFAERARIINSGADGMVLNGRIVLKNGTADINNGGGAWLYKADNSALLGFMGAQNNQNIGFYGGPAGWGFTYDAINSRIGIGNNNPNAPLSFPAALGKKITLYPGATGDVGMAVQGNLLQIYSDNPAADIAMGYDQGGSFTERFRVKANGALAVNGSIGNAGQLLQSNGAGLATTWITPVKYAESANGSNFTLNNIGDEAVISNVTVNLTQNSFVEVYGTVGLNAFNNAAHLYLIITDSYGSHIVAANQNVFSITTMSFVYRTNVSFTPGSHVFTLKVRKINGGGQITGSNGYTPGYGSPDGKIIARIIPQ